MYLLHDLAPRWNDEVVAKKLQCTIYFQFMWISINVIEQQYEQEPFKDEGELWDPKKMIKKISMMMMRDISMCLRKYC